MASAMRLELIQVPVSDIFPGIRGSVELAVEKQLAAFENELQERSGRGPGCADRDPTDGAPDSPGHKGRGTEA